MGTEAIRTENRQRLDALVTDPEAPDVVRRRIRQARQGSDGLGFDLVAVAVMAVHGRRRVAFLAATFEGFGVDPDSADAAARLFIAGSSLAPEGDE
jgi:hypothetical protein